jgi:tRNA uridine 5-carboxymethylaminomethyl modification enzyme
MKWVCERQSHLDVRQGQATRLIIEDRTAKGVETSLGVAYKGRTVVVTTGTFLRGLMHIGNAQQSGGRAGESAATALSASLIAAGLELGRLKTGTPPRLHRGSINFSKTEAQPGDEPIPYFTYWREDLFHVEHLEANNPGPSGPWTAYPPGSILHQIGGQLPCYITSTTPATASLIRENLHKSPLYAGVIQGIGPRYCPSIEDKIVRFADKDHHQVFLEPEGVATEEVYVNGFSTSLPFEVQVGLVRTIIGCEAAEIMRPAYAVEYDFAFPTQLQASLETKVCRNLFLAGQINGTSGYEEAAGQGLIAGINAARAVQGKPAVILRRDQAYLGVLIDDLVTKGTKEPYRMFTSRAEYRLLLRQDNADMRLSDLGHDIGLLPDRHFRSFDVKRRAIAGELARLETTRDGNQSMAQLLRRPEVSYADLPSRVESLDPEVARQVEISLKYDGYIQRQQAEVDRFKSLEEKQIPAWMDYSRIPGLKRETRQKLEEVKPGTLGQASRISGVTPSDLNLVLFWMKRAATDASNSGPESEESTTT